ncbi:MAG: hypothetical protein ACYS9C_02585 [Planctomycetota bacterium]|jgi:hypothetical protein
MFINIDNHIQSKHLQDVIVFHFDIVINLEKRKRMTEKKGERSMAGKTKNCLLFGRLLMLGMVVLIGTSVCSAASSDDVEVMRQEIKELRRMVKDLTKEVGNLKKVEGQESSLQTQYQRELDEIRADVTKLNESPMVDLADTMGKVKFGGYGEIHGTFTGSSKSDKMDFHRLVLYLGYDFANWIKFHSEIELEHAWTDDGYVLIEQALVDFLLSDNFNIRAGRLLTPIGIINKHHEPPLFNGVERPNFSKYIIPTTWSSDGVGFFGSLNSSLNYEAYVVAGLDGNSFTSSGIRDGRMKAQQSLTEPAFTGRLDYRPFEEALSNSDQSLRLGLSGYFGGLDNVDGGGGSGKDGEIALASADFEYSISKFDFRGVVAHTDIDGARNFGSGDVAEEMFGWYFEGAYHFWPDEWKTGKLEKSDATVFVRYEEYDTQHKMPSGIAKDQSKDIDELTFGVNFYLTPNFVIKADYQLRDNASGNDLDDLFNVGIGWMF